MKNFISIILFITMSITTFAKDPVKFGVTIGGNSTSISNYGGSKITYNGGILLQIPIISDKFYISPSVQYAKREFDLKWNVFNMPAQVTLNFAYIDVPVLFKLKSNTIGSNMKLFTSFGPTLHYIIKLHDYDEQAINSHTINRKNYSVGLNAGVEFSNKYQVGIGYNVGLSKIANDPKYKEPKFRTVTFGLTILL